MYRRTHVHTHEQPCIRPHPSQCTLYYTTLYSTLLFSALLYFTLLFPSLHNVAALPYRSVHIVATVHFTPTTTTTTTCNMHDFISHNLPAIALPLCLSKYDIVPFSILASHSRVQYRRFPGHVAAEDNQWFSKTLSLEG